MEAESGAADLAAARGCAEVPHRLRTVSGRREAAVGAGAGRRGGVNPNTMQRALAALEESGLVSAQRNTGRYVTQDEACIRETRRSLAQAEINAFCARMRQLGYTQEEIATLFGGNENE